MSGRQMKESLKEMKESLEETKESLRKPVIKAGLEAYT